MVKRLINQDVSDFSKTRWPNCTYMCKCSVSCRLVFNTPLSAYIIIHILLVRVTCHAKRTFRTLRLAEGSEILLQIRLLQDSEKLKPL